MKKLFCSILCLFLLLNSTLPAAANSAQMYWSGTSSTGVIVTDGSCPVIVQKEILTFSVEEFPNEHYYTLDEYLSYTGSVTAEYTFYNPADYTVTATLAFPFGKQPAYAPYVYRDDNTEDSLYDTGKYGVFVNGRPIETTLRHTLSSPYEPFNLSTDLPKLTDRYNLDLFYSPELPVTKYIYQANISTEKNSTTASFIWSGDRLKTRILLKGHSGSQLLSQGSRISAWMKNGDFAILYFFGEAPAPGPSWTFYEDGSCKTAIEGQMTLLDSQTMTFADFIRNEIEATPQISEIDRFNAVCEHFNQNTDRNGAMYDVNNVLSLHTSLLRWYQYEITLAPGETLVNTVTAPMYPSVHTDYNPSIYEYTYLLSPAKTWAKFGDLEISIHTPHYMTECSLEGFEKTEDGYSLRSDGLPGEELMFTLSSSKHPAKPIKTLFDYVPIEILISFSLLGGGAIALGVLIVLTKKQITKKQK